MAQAATMGPPLSPRETRRSGRRSAPSVSASTSKSPDSDQPPMAKASSSRAPVASASNRNKRLKQEDYDDGPDNRKNAPASSAASSSSQNGSNTGKAKRKTGKEKDQDKDKDRHPSSSDTADVDAASAEGQLQDPVDEEEEQGITRCVCGSAEDDPDAGEFMVQCEGCKAWQHGLCMGYQSEDQLHDDDYYCELCKPDLHVDLLKKLAKKQPRQASIVSRQGGDTHSRVSRSHSPSHLLKQPSKRRNTMNSRDAAFDESLKEIIEATAAEAAAVQEASANESVTQQPDINDNKKKRKRADEDANAKKRTRSASTASDRHSATAPPIEASVPEKAVSQAPKAPAQKNKRAGRKTAAIEITVIDTEEAASISTKRSTNNVRTKTGNNVKRPPLSQAQGGGGGGGGGGQHPGTTAADSRAYRNSHAYAVSQQLLYTSWGLPDHLAHLEPILPTEVPQPLEVRSGGPNTGSNGRGESAERTMERGVKVKWPTKRLSVGDMNKRVRTLVEWVGREQAGALDRGRRREALEKVLREQVAEAESADPADRHVQMIFDDQQHPPKPPIVNYVMSERALDISGKTMKMMEELMEELIGFQEKFGPGVKNRERERRTAQ